MKHGGQNLKHRKFQLFCWEHNWFQGPKWSSLSSRVEYVSSPGPSKQHWLSESDYLSIFYPQCSQAGNCSTTVLAALLFWKPEQKKRADSKKKPQHERMNVCSGSSDIYVSVWDALVAFLSKCRKVTVRFLLGSFWVTKITYHLFRLLRCKWFLSRLTDLKTWSHNILIYVKHGKSSCCSSTDACSNGMCNRKEAPWGSYSTFTHETLEDPPALFENVT